VQERVVSLQFEDLNVGNDVTDGDASPWTGLGLYDRMSDIYPSRSASEIETNGAELAISLSARRTRKYPLNMDLQGVTLVE